ncbi:MAG TPA: hypothetical protein VF020_16285 [Chthoniobacterales bacterium]
MIVVIALAEGNKNDLPDLSIVPEPDGGALHCVCRVGVRARPESASKEIDCAAAATPRKPSLRNRRSQVSACHTLKGAAANNPVSD